jgi:hypothetical protein
MSEEYLNYNYKMPVNKGKQKQLITDIMNADAKDGLYKQQTAVEWLINAVEANMGDIPLEVQEQAKEMEKEQITDSYIMGSYDMANKEFRPEQYYNKTYGGNK